MADIVDVADALVAACALALYPTGLPAGPAPASPLLGAPARIYAGWPQPAQLDKDLRDGIVTVSVYAQPGVGRTTTRYPESWHEGDLPAPAMTATAAGQVVTLTGTPAPSQVAAIILGTRLAATYRPAAGDTLAAVATGLAAGLAGATASGATVTVPGSPVTARVVQDVPARRELRRQEQGFQVIVWAPTPALRDLAAATVDVALAPRHFLTLADGSKARLLYGGTRSQDGGTEALLFRRDLLLTAEYPTTETRAMPTAAVVVTEIGPPAGPAATVTIR